MKVILISARDDDDNRDAFRVIVDGMEYMYFSDGEPEDNTLKRNFNHVYRMSALIQQVFNAALKGEALELESGEVTWDQLWEY